VAVVVATAGVAAAQSRTAAVLRVTGAAPGAAVYVDGIRHGRADAKGTLEVRTIPPGRRSVLVRQTGFVDFTQAVAFAAGRPAVVTPKRVPLDDDAELAFQRGEDLALSGKNGDAVPAYLEAIRLRGRPYPQAQIGLSRAYVVIKKTEEATAAAAAAVDALPKSVEAHTVLGTALRERGLYDEAADEYRRAIALAPDRSPEPHTGLAVVLAEQGNHAAAVAEYRKALAQNQDAEPVIYQLLGTSLERIDRPKEAIAAYERFLALAPSHALAPAVRSIVERLRSSAGTQEDEGDVNPYAPKTPR
jgi:cytochrome c-type biogenesis protein CcmH/NrfG